VASELVQPDRLIEDGSSPLGPKGRLRAIWTPGHTPGHLCFIDEARELVFTGDHVLPRVSPNIALNPGGTGNPLADFLGSLERMRYYDGSQMLPAHEYRFRGAGYRAKVLIEHHEARLSEICELINRSPGASTWEVAAALTWSRGWAALSGLMRRSALSETYAHLIYLHSVECAENRGLGVDSWWPVAGGC
jgi:glyoxylase-like metal-dependent hydrolase (beta-lactamase superfamily II)